MKKWKMLAVTVMTMAISAATFLGVPQGAYAATQGVNVQTHTQAEIISYLEQKGAKLSDPVVYEVTPSYTQPFSLGQLSLGTQYSGLAMLNQIRYIAGLSEVTLDTQRIQQMQAATVVNAANDVLSHDPTQPAGMSDEMYAQGAGGAGSANLAMGFGNLNQCIVGGWLGDYTGSNLDAVGHRRWALNPSMGKTCFGVTGRYYSMYAFDRSNYSSITGVVWPAQQMPLEYFDEQFPWSYNLGTAVDASTVKVTLTKRGTDQAWKFSTSSADGHFAVNNVGYGMSGCIIFRPKGVSYAPGDIFDVTITGLSTPVQYSVEFFSINRVGMPDPVRLTAFVERRDHLDSDGRLDYQFTAPSAGTYTFYSTGQIDTVGNLYSDISMYDSSLIGFSDDYGGTANFSITVDLAANQTVYLQVVGYGSSNGDIGVNVRTDFGITKQPANVTSEAGKSVTFSVTAVGEGLTYQWQYKNAASSAWASSGAAAAKTANMTFTVGTDSSLNGRQYRCVVTDENGISAISNAATLTVTKSLAITKQPANVTAEAGKSVTFSVTATGEGLTYQWQYKNASATTWSTSGAAAAKTANMTFTVGTDKTLNGRQYRCVVKDKNGKTVTSNAATLTVVQSLVITKQPANVSAEAGKSVTFSVTATGEGLTYQWQYKNASATTWSNSGAAAAKTANMTFTVGTDKTLNGRQYRCVVTDKNGKTVNSNAATLTVITGPAITSQPVNQTAAAGASVTFKVTATGEGLTYQWQYRNAGASAWSNSGAAAAKTANMTFTVGTDKTLNGRQYRCVVTDKNGKTVTSNAATLTVAPSLAITSQPTNQTAAAGASVTFKVTATGEGLTYQWQYKNASASAWSNSGAAAAKTANMTFTVGTDKTLNGRQYRCVVTDKNGKTVTSNAATLTVK